MDAYLRVLMKWGIDLPHDYRYCHGQGLLNYQRRPAFLHSFYRWMSPEEIAVHEWPSYKIATLVPIAREASMSCLCWSTVHGPGWVFESPSDSCYASGYAPSFAGALYRATISDLEYCTVPGQEGIPVVEFVESLRTCVQACNAIWPAEWVSTLLGILARTPTWVRDGDYSFVTKTEAGHLVKKYVDFPMLDQEIEQYVKGWEHMSCGKPEPG